MNPSKSLLAGVVRDSKSQCDSEFTMSSTLTTGSILSTAGSFGQVSLFSEQKTLHFHSHRLKSASVSVSLDRVMGKWLLETAKTHPVSDFGWALVGWVLGHSLILYALLAGAKQKKSARSRFCTPSCSIAGQLLVNSCQLPEDQILTPQPQNS